MALNPANARIFGSELDSIWLAPIGTPLPSLITDALNGAFEDVGWLSDDGVVEEQSGSKTKYRGHQGNAVIRTRMTESGTEYTFVAAETKAQTRALRYNEKSVSNAGGQRTATVGAGQRVSPRAAILDFYDADDVSIRERIAIARFEIVPDGSASFVADGIRMFPFRGEQIGDAIHMSNNPAPKTAWTLTLTGTATAGTYTLIVNGYATAPIAYNANAAAIQSAVNALVGVTGATVTVTGTGPWTLTFNTAVLVNSTSALTGAVASVA
jgi:hypothetical protein